MKSRDGKYSAGKTQYGSYRVRFYCENNERQEKWVKTKTEQEALIRAVKRRERLDYWFPANSSLEASSENRPGLGSFAALADEWMKHGRYIREISESCLGNYRSHLDNHILPVLGTCSLQDLNIKSIESVAEILKKTRPKSRSYVSVRNNRQAEEFFEDDEFLSTAYRREILTVACMVTKFGFERKEMPANPFADYVLPDCPEQPYDYWRIEDEDSFLEWLENGGQFLKRVAKSGSVKKGKPEYFDRQFKMRPGKADELYDVVLFALRSGLRKGEIGALRSRDVNLGSNFIIVRRSWSEKERTMKNTTKGKTFRRIELNPDMKEILEKRMRRTKSEDDLLFDVRSWAIKNFSKYCRKAGVREIHFHSLRHTCLTNLANGYGMDRPLPLPQVQAIAGHKDISTTMRYVHTNGIEDTTSRQWSREERRSKRLGLESPSSAEPEKPVALDLPTSLPKTVDLESEPAPIKQRQMGHLRVISGGVST